MENSACYTRILNEKFTIKQEDISMSILRKQTRNSLCVIFAGNNLIVYIDFVLAGL